MSYEAETPWFKWQCNHETFGWPKDKEEYLTSKCLKIKKHNPALPSGGCWGPALEHWHSVQQLKWIWQKLIWANRFDPWFAMDALLQNRFVKQIGKILFTFGRHKYYYKRCQFPQQVKRRQLSTVVKTFVSQHSKASKWIEMNEELCSQITRIYFI